MKSPYDFRDYKKFLKAVLPVEGPKRGARNRLAEALNCQKGFVSQVLNGNSHFSLEHGMKICRFLHLDSQEEEYFLLLLHKERAGSKDLETFYEKKLLEIQERRSQIKDRIQIGNTLGEAQQVTYYSSWLFCAVHMCLMVPQLTSKTAISSFLGVPPRTIGKILDFFLLAGLAKQEGDRIVSGPARIHLPNHSPLISKHHTNWRVRAIDSLDCPHERDLHYTLIMSISEEAATKIREILLNAIQNIEPVIKEAEDQDVCCLNIDLFGLRWI